MGIVLVEICDINAIALAWSELEALEQEFPGVTVIRTSCLSMCETCSAMPYAFVNGELVFAERKEELLEKIKRAITRELANFEA
jgi:uncharacterized protein YuzB (UPF0349 family)